MNFAVILAGGSGVRVGANVPKQFIEIYGKPVLCYTLEKFQNNKNIDAIEVVCIEPYVDTLKNLIKRYKLDKVKYIVRGGQNFTESVINGVNGLKGIAKDEDILVIHFGASPFVEDDVIDDSIRVCKEKGNAISTIPFYYLSTFRDKNDPEQSAGDYVARETLACMNSPHSFKYSVITNIFKKAIETGAFDKVEPHVTTLMHYLGEIIYFSKGSQTNIKITTSEDLELFKAYALLHKK